MFGRLRLLRENAMMREALRFYAAGANWRRRAIHSKGMPKRWDKCAAAYDRGGTAVAVILEIESARATTWSRRFKNLFRNPPPPKVFHVPAPRPPKLTLTAPTPKAPPCIEQPTSSTEFSTTEPLTVAKSGRTVGSADTPAETP